MAKIKWKTKEVIEAEKNTSKPLSEMDKLRIEMAQSNAELFEMMLMMNGGSS